MKPQSRLPNPPLLEAIFELKWTPSAASRLVGAFPNVTVQAGAPPLGIPGLSDPRYPIHLGRFSERAEKQYPFHEVLPAASLPEMMVVQIPQHRFRVAEERWPLVQMGPGIMSVNETTGYTWTDFRARCLDAMSWILEAKPDPAPMASQELTLRYLNAVEFSPDEQNVFSILAEGLSTKVELPAKLFQSSGVSPSPSGLNWQATFAYGRLPGSVTIQFSTGTKEEKPVLIWGTAVQSGKGQMPELSKGFTDWLENAHSIAEAWFFDPIGGPLERSFKGGTS